MAINYTKTNWVNGQAPAISAGNLNKIEQGIKDACDAVDLLTDNSMYIIEAQSKTQTISGSSGLGYTFTPTEHSGYECVGIVGFNTDHPTACIVTSTYVDDTVGKCWVRNNGSGSQSTTLTVLFLYIRNNI